MRHIGLFDAKTRLSELVADAENGTPTIITRRGQPVAQITPVQQQSDHNDLLARMERLAESIHKRHPLGLSQDEAVALTREGRRYS